ncbi:hypothetical protein CERZMDRAFT_100124 [Cercospora zeae-maydis SCOH1-5]|uniref:Uncharacterized protein n=1 Tax=Cercospora zeae-maydis SCOH1-5 TaxID=717836 RepID=A0A6A6F5I8_9PEZI|nr:hypothetical protein CERZMDRAFT_100124 [Cercospora zeae-maydis SCOH1-5]
MASNRTPNKGKGKAKANNDNGGDQQQAPSGTAGPSRGAVHKRSRAKDNPDVKNVRRFGNAEALEKEAGRRWIEYGFLVDEFDTLTKTSRAWHSTSVAHKTLRAMERARIQKQIPKLEAELKKCQEELQIMAKADEDWERKFGLRCEQGEWDTMKLDKFRGFLRLEHDEVPDL